MLHLTHVESGPARYTLAGLFRDRRDVGEHMECDPNDR